MHRCETLLRCYCFTYFGADLRKLASSQASANTARPRIRASVSSDMPVYSPVFAGYRTHSISSLTTEGGLRMSRPGCLDCCNAKLNQIIYCLWKLTRSLQIELDSLRPLETYNASMRGSIGLILIQILCRILLLCPWFNFAQNVISSPVGGSDYLPQSPSNFIQYSWEAKETSMLTRDIGTDTVKTAHIQHRHKNSDQKLSN